jgi:hypothetical protein
MSTTKSRTSSIDNEDNTGDILVIAPDNVNNSSFDNEMTCEKIQLLLKKKSLTVIKASKTHTAVCWKNFGFPAVIDENGKIVKTFHSFVACRNCFTTYSFKSNSTTIMNKHKCDNSSFLSSSTNSQNNSQSLKQSKISSYSSKTAQSVRLNECEKNKIKKLQVEWVCTDIRPFRSSMIMVYDLLYKNVFHLVFFHVYKYISSFILLCYYRFKIWKYSC